MLLFFLIIIYYSLCCSILRLTYLYSLFLEYNPEVHFNQHDWEEIGARGGVNSHAAGTVS